MSITTDEGDFSARAAKVKRMLHMQPGYVGTCTQATKLIDDLLAALPAPADVNAEMLGALTPPFDIYGHNTEIGDAKGHVCTAENPEIAKAILACLNAAVRSARHQGR